MLRSLALACALLTATPASPQTSNAQPAGYGSPIAVDGALSIIRKGMAESTAKGLKMAGICRGHGKEPEFVWTQYKAYATPAVISESRRPPKEKQTKTVYYTLMPGIIPVQHRAEAGGACRVIMAVELEMKWIPGGVGVHYADENRPDPNARHGVGVPSAPAAPLVPKADSCN
ncbi:hypothetical protein [Sphingomonas sp. G-3-2-10]|uniref:hypothetical protein n=1 Tax=Sphingomonas sp. G-3-2-10 TaxID=2728838 RepID=UPI00146D05AA|nr:hypothetical protein [Sphingomonas sp. G-3-2-10]NML04813.1 hypothetical protein [Sphingomonas sp. G-3-2-10]